MGLIALLDAHTINQIAAGEVVERPASVIRELAENAVDAGATEVAIEIEEGGLARIRVVDNGCGMSREDAAMAFKRHATSKLQDARQLEDIGTLGFRGEALAAIAAVSQVTLDTCVPASGEGTCIVLEGGQQRSIGPSGCPDGTSIEVSNLFFNAPARRRYMKTPGAEAAACTEQVLRMALAHPEVAFTLDSNGKTVFSTAGDGDSRRLLCEVLNEDEAHFVPVSFDSGGLKLSGWIGLPEASRGNRTRQFVIMGGRVVKSPPVTLAVERAYQGKIPSGRFPVYVLCAQFAAGELDVNVHPAKLEVRLKYERQVVSAVQAVIANALDGALSHGPVPTKSQAGVLAPHVPENVAKAPASLQEKGAAPRLTPPPGRFILPGGWHSAGNGKLRQAPSVMAGQVLVKPFDGDDAPSRPYSGAAGGDGVRGQAQPGAQAPCRPDGAAQTVSRAVPTDGEGEHAPSVHAPGQPQMPDCPAAAGAALPTKKQGQDEIGPLGGQGDTLRPVDTVCPAPAEGNLPLPGMEEAARPARWVGQIFHTYLLYEQEDKLYLIDQHAAHERYLYERYRRELLEGPVPSQALLEPVMLPVSPREAGLVEENQDVLAAMGFDLSLFGPLACRLTGVPHFLADAPFEALVRDVLDALGGEGEDPVRERVMRMACRKAVKAGAELPQEAARMLLEMGEKEGCPLTCPHGRPIWVELSRREIEKKFKRVL
nr:DNA mismatch repair endonuclease MutL [bacterium]